MNTGKYPHLKVFFAFWFMPFAVGLVAGPVIFVAMVARLFANPRTLGEVHGLELWAVFISTPVMVQLIYLLPALGFALFVTLRRFRKGRSAYKTIALSGGTVAFVWLALLTYLVMRDSEVVWFISNGLPLMAAFLIGALGSGLMAVIALPEPSGACEVPVR
ncbi:hypothetical protein [Pseudomonas rhodesiae]|uniref:hypothetical protein n=1 Tax=Pseudomonas rhodesiae TaxID=76760 RepID=UPI00241BEB79|nr:hypothetical protein [Pseudomonas rhodesiae]